MIAVILLAWAAPAVFVGAALAACLLLHRDGDLFTRSTWGLTEDDDEWTQLRAAVDGPDWVAWEAGVSA